MPLDPFELDEALAAPARPAFDPITDVTADETRQHQRAITAEPGNGTKYTILLVDLLVAPLVAIDALDSPPRSWLLVWLNSPKRPHPATVVANSTGLSSVAYLARTLSIPQKDAQVLAGVVGYALGGPTT